MAQTIIRAAARDDAEVVRRVHESAFPTPAEADLVEQLEANKHLLLSFVAEVDGEVVGHIAFSPVTIEPTPTKEYLAAGLGPVAVVPDHQRRGIGGELIKAGLSALPRADYDFVVVLGHPEYYPRFGFRRASEFGLDNEYGADAAFMALELQPGRLDGITGLVRYGPEFAAFD